MKIKTLIILILAILLTSCYSSPSEMASDNQINTFEPSIEQSNENKNIEIKDKEGEQTDFQTPEIVQDDNILHISENINGSTINLTIDLDVIDYSDNLFGIYDASLIDINIDEVLKFVFPEYSKDELYHVYCEEWYQDHYNIGDMDYRNIILNFGMRDTGKLIMYDPNNDTFPFFYSAGKSLVVCDPHGAGSLLRREQEYMIPDETLLNEAVDLSYTFLNTIFENEFTENFNQIYSGKKETEVDDYHTGAANEVYLTVYQRQIEELSVLYDKRTVKMGYYTDPLVDELEVWVNDGQVLLAHGAIRHLELAEEVEIITAEEALSVLKTYFDTIEAKGSYDIERFELMYYATFTDDADTTDIYGKQIGAGYVKYIPVWVIASGERYKKSDEFVMIIDAVTRLPIERRKG